MTSTHPPRQTALVKAPAQGLTRFGFEPDQVDLIKRTIAKGVDDDELSLFLSVARATGLDPFQRQIHAVRRWDRDANREVMAIQIGIDGYRSISQRTGEDDGMDAPQWCGVDGEWTDVWLGEHPPAAARVTVYRRGVSRPYIATVLWSACVQTTKDGKANHQWRTRGPHMLAKCAEALARRMAFPVVLGGTITDDEAEDAEFIDRPAAASTVKALPEQSARSEPARSAAPAAPAAPAAAAPAKPEATEQDVVDLIGEMSRAGDVASLRATTTRMASLVLTDAQRARLNEAYAAQKDLIRAAAAAEANP